ncbi:MAG: hypothetical protein KAK00_09240 [Nanoarchaeota archaeon]|nr:hypothetical protein [Nanoarchaeota archaeon]
MKLIRFINENFSKVRKVVNLGEWKEITIYVHGITPEENVGSHSDIYRKLHKNINSELKKRNKPLLGKPIMVEWGWDKSTGKDKDLARAERKIAKITLSAYKKNKDFTLNPARLAVKAMRPIFIRGFADMFYYVSEDGKKTVRKTVFNKVLSELSRAYRKSPEKISITCIGHSAGTIILHDLLYNIFTKNYTSKNLPPAYKYIRKDLLAAIRKLAKNKKIRLRKFYSMGSPITPLTFRSNSLIEKVVKNPDQKKGFLKPEDIGIVDLKNLSRPRWVNFWDPDDIISYPVGFLYNNEEKIIEDRVFDVSDNPLKAHNEYWENKKVAKHIAKTYWRL